MSSSSSSVAVAKICFNYRCMEALSNPPPGRRTGWRLRCGEMAELCDRCSCAFEQGNFCETFHSDDGGWRNCETCDKRVHCGCIVSLPTYIFLDAGGIDCVACARKSVLAATNQMLSPMFMPQQVSAPGKSWKPASGSFYGQLRQSPHMWNMTSTQSDLQQRLSFEFDRPNSIEKLTSGGRYSIFNNEKKFKNLSGRSTGGLDNVLRERYANRKVVLDPASAYGTFQEGNIDGQKDSSHLVGANDSISTRKTVNADPCSTRLPGTNIEAHPNSCVNSLLPSAKKEETSSLGLVSPFQLMNGSKELMGFLPNQSHNQAGPPLSKQSYSQYVIDEDLQTQTRNGKPRADNRAQSHLLPRYWPKISDQELQQKSGDSNSMITPLFEKMLSASDAGRIGRLVLPKKCAEPEGLPLKVQDPNGKDWVFQFRFWPNNNSRMFVLEGVTPCIQAMQLQAGDTVTFSRMDPVGKLLMGFRKASGVSAEQDSRTVKSSNGFSAIQGGETKATDVKGITEARDLINTAGQQNCFKLLDDGLLRKVGLGA